MISLTTFMSVVAALTLVLVVLQIVLRGSMPAARRLRFERVMMWGLYPALTMGWAVRAVFGVIEGDLLWTLVPGLLVVSMAAQGLMLWRKTPAADGTRT